MTILFSYCIRIDDGAAPNPFWGVCTLTICKPAIRRVAAVGDWIVGTGSANSPIGDIRGKVVFVMQVSQKMTLQEYDSYTKTNLPNKIPLWFNRDARLRLGDSIYDFSSTNITLRNSVHKEENMKRDLHGKYALLSNDFYYFGDKPVQLPDYLLPIVKQGRGHKSHANDAFIVPFLTWLDSLGLKPNHLYGNPQYRIFEDCFIGEC